MVDRIASLLPGWRVESYEGLRRPDWLAKRREDVTASELGCLFGDTRYLTPLGLYMRKLQGERDEENEMMKRGRVMEPAAAKLLSIDLPCLSLTSCEGNYLRLRTDDPFVRIGATKDYQGRGRMSELGPALAQLGAAAPAEWGTGDVSLAVELKAVQGHAYQTHWSDGPPRQYVLQATTQAMLGGDDGAILAALVVSSSFQIRLVIYCIRRDFDAELAIVERARDFWEGYDRQELPEAQAADNRLLASVYPAKTGESIDLPPEWSDILRDREEDRELIAALERGNAERDVKLKSIMQSAERAKLRGWNISWKQNARARPLVIKPE